MTNKSKPLVPEEMGLLAHEEAHVNIALGRAHIRRVEANLNFGEAVEASGGDWAFDDAGAQAAAQEAAVRDGDVRKLASLAIQCEKYGIMPYPEENQLDIVPGSRVVFAMRGKERVYDLGTRVIPGLRAMDGATILSSQAPLGRALLHATLGEEIVWQLPDARTLSGNILDIDQTAQQRFYAPLLSIR